MLKNGFAFKSSLFKETGTPIVRISNIQDDRITTDFVYFDKNDYRETLDKYEVYEGDILIAMSGATTGKVGINTNSEVLYLNQRVGKFVPQKELYSLFLFYYLKRNANFSLSVAQGMAQPNLSTQQINNFIIPIPPLDEQERIVAELDLLSIIIEKKKAQLKERDQLAQSIFYNMFGDLYSTVFPTMTLIDICEFIKDGTHQTPTYTEDKENGIKFLSAKDVVEGVINWENIKYISVELHKELHKRIAPKRNDLLLCKNGTTGICAIVETDEIFDIYVSLALLRPKEPFCPKYLLYAINNPYTKEQFAMKIYEKEKLSDSSKRKCVYREIEIIIHAAVKQCLGLLDRLLYQRFLSLYCLNL